MRLLALGGVAWAGSEWLLQSPWGVVGGIGGLFAWGVLAWLDRRYPSSPWVGVLGLLYDLCLVGMWLILRLPVYWLLFVPGLYATRRYGVGLALVGAGLTPALLWGLAALGALPNTPEESLWMWGGVLCAGHLALAWVVYRPQETLSRETIERMTQILEQRESAYCELRHSYRELAHHYRRLQESLETMQDTLDLFLALRQASTPHDAYRTILERLRARFSASGAALYLADETGIALRVALTVGTLTSLHGTVRIDAPRKTARQAIEQQVRAVLQATQEHSRETLADAHALGGRANPQLLTLPLRTPQRLIGMLTLVARHANGFDLATENRLHALVPHLLALIQLYEQIEVMGLRLQEIQALHDLDNLLFTLNLPNEVPQRALEILQTVVPFECAQLYLLCEDRFTLQARWTSAPEVMPNLQFGEASGIEGWLQQRQPLLQIADTHQSPYVPNWEAIEPIRHLVIVNLNTGMRTTGVLILGHSQPHFFTEAQIELVQVLAIHLGLVLERAHLLTHLEQLAITDGLTGLHNYRYFQERYQEEVRLVKRYQHPLAVMLLDVDNFKQVNDRYGHLEGDYLLVQIAEVLQRTLRTTELTARYGGDEFVVIMPSTQLEGAHIASERLRQAVAQTQFATTSGQHEISITLSIGVAAYPDSTDRPDQLLELADLALEKAKRTGRNRTVVIENTV